MKGDVASATQLGIDACAATAAAQEARGTERSRLLDRAHGINCSNCAHRVCMMSVHSSRTVSSRKMSMT